MSKRGSKRVNLYANLSNRRKANKEYKARRKAEYLASLPKHPVKRILYRMHPKRFFAYWFSKDGFFMSLRLIGVGLAIVVVLFGMLFLYYRRELDAISPDQLSQRVQTTVTRYYDRNDVLLWEDKGDGNYKLAVKSDEISKYMKDATVAIEDKDFYQHGGFSLSGIFRAAWSNATGGGSTQGGSTLTQQLIKQVFFSDQAGDRGLSGVPRKIKEVILSVQVENMYSKDQILTMYLNESPYGGRGNGVESAAKAYFHKSAKDLTLAESALLAAIPQSPTYFSPYNIEGHEALIARQHTVLDYMSEQGMITADEAQTAKNVAIIDEIQPETNSDMKAPHFVQMVKSQLSQELGAKVVGDGGLTVKTTLDTRVQDVIEGYMNKLFASNVPTNNKFDNGAAVMIDSQTGQILGLVGSRDYNYPGYGAFNSTTGWLQPGSTIKPEVYAAFLKGNNGAGTIIPDTAIPQSIYKTESGQSVQNFDNKWEGNITVREALARSRNIPAIKAMNQTGVQTTWDTIRAMGDTKYCTNGQEVNAGLSSSIGGCTSNMLDHVNAFATIARSGTYEPVASILEVKNAQGQTVKQWQSSPKQAIDPQIAYQLADIMSDENARRLVMSPATTGGFLPSQPDGVKIAGKTGTSNDGSTGYPKDLWFMSYSPKATFGVWVGNHDTKPLSPTAYSFYLGSTNGGVMHDTHVNIFQKDGTWKPKDWFAVPAGLQKLTVNGKTDWFPSWFNKAKATVTEKMKFDKVSKKKATSCTPANAVVEVEVPVIGDAPNKSYVTTSDGYDPNANDDVHQCSDTPPTVNTISVSPNGSTYIITVNVTDGIGGHPVQTIEVKVGGNSVGTVQASGSGSYSLSYQPTQTGAQTVSATATDNALNSSTYTLPNSYTF